MVTLRSKRPLIVIVAYHVILRMRSANFTNKMAYADYICHLLVIQTTLSLIHISEPTRLGMISYAVFCLKKKK